jgi:hypothetical protein
MKNTLYVFGCSFSEIFTKDNYESYYNYKNKKLPKTWSEILAKNLNLNLKNYAKGGNCNEVILQSFAQNLNSFKENDIVIFQWSFPERFSWIDDDKNLIGTSWSGWKNTLDEKTANKIATTRSFDVYKNQILDFQKFIEELSKFKKFQVWFWHADASLHKLIDTNDMRYLIINKIMKDNKPYFLKTTFDVVYELGGCDIETETNGLIKDNHFGESAHQIKADLFFDHIKKYEHLYN